MSAGSDASAQTPAGVEDASASATFTSLPSATSQSSIGSVASRNLAYVVSVFSTLKLTFLHLAAR
jgi:hypothetical protein